MLAKFAVLLRPILQAVCKRFSRLPATEESWRKQETQVGRVRVPVGVEHEPGSRNRQGVCGVQKL